VAGRLVAVHRLRPSSRPLDAIVGAADFKRIQDMWAEGDKRYRWSVAFPIIESYSIVDMPPANQAFTTEQMKRLFAHPSATLRPLEDDERAAIGDLRLAPRSTANTWIGIEDEIAMAEQSHIDPILQKRIDADFTGSALEGFTVEQKLKIRRRAAWLAQRFAKQRRDAGLLCCDECGFDPISKVVGTAVKPRSLMGVHHTTPLDEGKRYTTVRDFKLLCPNCHRLVHLVSKVSDLQ